MELPNVVHPMRFNIRGVIIEIVSYDPLTDSQAKNAAMFFYRSRKWKKADQGKLFRHLTTFDSTSARLLSAD